MAHPTYLRDKARELRLDQRLTLDEIAARLALPRSTIFAWIADLPLRRTSPSASQDAARRRGNLAMQRKYRLLREAAYEEGRRCFGGLAEDPTFRDFVCLYIGEGYKRSRNVVSLANSDPAVVKLAVGWMRQVTARPLGFGLQYHVDQAPEQLRRFWSRELGVESESIRLQRKSNSGQLAGRSWRSKHGVLTVRACDTMLRARLEAWIDCVRESWLYTRDQDGA